MFKIIKNKLTSKYLLVILFGFLGMFYGAANAYSNEGRVAARLVDIAGQQRMLTQKIVKNYLMIASGVNVVKAQDEIDKSIGMFEQNLSTILDEMPDNTDIENIVSVVERYWLDFRMTSLEGSVANSKRKTKRFVIEGERLLRHSQALVEKLVDYYSVKGAKIVDVAGRQRMLSQRIGKYYLAYYYGLRDKEIVRAFNKAVSEFDKGLEKLIAYKGNDKKLKRSLKNVKMQWTFSKKGFENFPTEEKMLPFIISVTTDTIQKKMNRVTKQYVALLARSKT